MSAVDFASWAFPDLVLTLPDRDGTPVPFRVRPPSVHDSARVIALAVRFEFELGIEKGEIPEGVQEVLDSIEPGEHPALGDAYAELFEHGVNPITIDRMACYAIFYWARGAEYAEWIAATLFAPRGVDDEGGDEPSPKGS